MRWLKFNLKIKIRKVLKKENPLKNQGVLIVARTGIEPVTSGL